MSAKLPDYVPAPLRDVILDKYGTRGLAGLAEDIHLPYNTVLNIFKRANHKYLEQFIKAAGVMEVDPEQFADLLELEVDRRKSHLELLINRPVSNVKDFTGVHNSYIYSLLRGRNGEQVPRIYRPMAKKLSLSLNKLYETLIAS